MYLLPPPTRTLQRPGHDDLAGHQPRDGRGPDGEIEGACEDRAAVVARWRGNPAHRAACVGAGRARTSCYASRRASSSRRSRRPEALLTILHRRLRDVCLLGPLATPRAGSRSMRRTEDAHRSQYAPGARRWPYHFDGLATRSAAALAKATRAGAPVHGNRADREIASGAAGRKACVTPIASEHPGRAPGTAAVLGARGPHRDRRRGGPGAPPARTPRLTGGRGQQDQVQEVVDAGHGIDVQGAGEIVSELLVDLLRVPVRQDGRASGPSA